MRYRLEQGEPGNAARTMLHKLKDERGALHICEAYGLYDFGLVLIGLSGNTGLIQEFREKAIEAKIKEGKSSEAAGLMAGDKRMQEKLRHFCEMNGHFEMLAEIEERGGNGQRADGIRALAQELRVE